MLNLLLKHSKKPNVDVIENNDGTNAIFWSCNNNNLEMLNLLLKYSKEPNIDVIKNNNGTNAIYWACANNNSKMVELLMQYDANPNVIKKDDLDTPMMRAAYNSNIEIMKLLLNDGKNYRFKHQFDWVCCIV